MDEARRNGMESGKPKPKKIRFKNIFRKFKISPKKRRTNIFDLEKMNSKTIYQCQKQLDV